MGVWPGLGLLPAGAAEQLLLFFPWSKWTVSAWADLWAQHGCREFSPGVLKACLCTSRASSLQLISQGSGMGKCVLRSWKR